MKTALYLGTDPTFFVASGAWEGHVIHYPIIKIVPRSAEDPQIKQAYDSLSSYTHLLFTSKNGVRLFFDHLTVLHKTREEIRAHKVIAVGRVTARSLQAQLSHKVIEVAEQEQQEGIIALLEAEDLSQAHLLLPGSSLARPLLSNYLEKRGARTTVCALYDTVSERPEQAFDFASVDALIFTSPSTVQAFGELFGALPAGKELLAVGPITEEALKCCARK